MIPARRVASITGADGRRIGAGDLVVIDLDPARVRGGARALAAALHGSVATVAYCLHRNDGERGAVLRSHAIDAALRDAGLGGVGWLPGAQLRLLVRGSR